jgi:hypothetical protein
MWDAHTNLIACGPAISRGQWRLGRQLQRCKGAGTVLLLKPTERRTDAQLRHVSQRHEATARTLVSEAKNMYVCANRPGLLSCALGGAGGARVLGAHRGLTPGIQFTSVLS